MIFLFSNTSFKLHNTGVKTDCENYFKYFSMIEHNILGKAECLSFFLTKFSKPEIFHKAKKYEFFFKTR